MLKAIKVHIDSHRTDHGGVGTKHGGDSPTERFTPVILYGPTLKQGLQINEITRTWIYATWRTR